MKNAQDFDGEGVFLERLVGGILLCVTLFAGGMKKQRRGPGKYAQ